MALWLVTGATGFVGRHVLDALTEDVGRRSANANGNDKANADAKEILVLGRRRPADWPANRFIEADLCDPSALRRALRGVAPDYVVHAAGRTPPAPDDELYRANFWGTAHLLSALRASGRPSRVVLLGSAAELGPVDESRLPVNEDCPCNPSNAYGRGKFMATRQGLAERPPLEVMVARAFNPIGPGMPASQAFGRFAAELAQRVARGDAGPLELETGDLEARRDFIDVRDIARAMIALAEQGRSGLVYHVGTGASRRVGEGLDELARLSGRTVHVRHDPDLLVQRGPADSSAAIGRILDHTAWRPLVSWERSLADLWDDALALAHHQRERKPTPAPPAPVSLPARLAS